MARSRGPKKPREKCTPLSGFSTRRSRGYCVHLSAVVFILSLIACSRRSDPVNRAGPLASLALDPAQLPPGCQLRWTTLPMALSVATAQDRKFFNVVTGFWTGRSHSIDPAEVEVGLSNFYATPSNEQALVAVSIRFLNVSTATRVEAQLSASQPPIWVNRSGRLLTMIASDPSLAPDCVEPLKQHVQAAGNAASLSE